MSYFPETYTRIRNNMNVELDFSDYLTIPDLKRNYG